jgi:hypothetical protein
MGDSLRGIGGGEPEQHEHLPKTTYRVAVYFSEALVLVVEEKTPVIPYLV